MTQRKMRTTRWSVSVLAALALALTSTLVSVQPAQAATGDLLPPFDPGQTWYICQGYSSSVTHTAPVPNTPGTGYSQYGLDLTAGASCGAGAVGLNARAPLAGTVSYWQASSGTLCINVAGSRSIALTHIVSTLSAGATVTAGQVVGTVAGAAASSPPYNGGVEHIHFQIWGATGCYNSSTLPFDSAHTARICGAPNLTATDPNGNTYTNGVWSGVSFVGTSCSAGADAVSSYLEVSGINHVFSANSSGEVYDTSWGGGSPLTTWMIANTGSAVTSLSSQVSGGVIHVFAASSNGAVHDISWGNGNPLTAWQVWNNGQAGNVITSQVSGGVFHVYTGTNAGTLHETSWGNGVSLTTWQVASLGSPVASVSSQLISGVNHIISATNSGSVRDTSWGNGNALTTWQVWNNSQAGNFISSQVSGGVFHVYTGTAAGTVHETSWGNGNSLTTWQVASIGTAVNSISSQLVGGVNHVYSSTTGGNVRETSWGNGTSLTTWQVWSSGLNGNVISSQFQSNGVQHVYTGTTSGVYDTSWGNGAPLTTWQVK